jgi:CheY-like chemotaxis protein
MKAQKNTLLVIDDDEDQRFFIQKQFEALSARYHIVPLGSGNEAIAYLKGEGKFSNRKLFEFPGYVITDLQMDDGDGFHVLQFIKEHPALSVIPVIMLSSSEDTDDIRQAYLLGVSSYFVKPSELPALRALLKKIHEYWAEGEVPQVDKDGYALETQSLGKLGARYPKPTKPPEP